MPASLRIRAPAPSTRGFGSRIPKTTLARRCSTMIREQAGVRPWNEHGSSVEYIVAPSMTRPWVLAYRAAAISAWSSPGPWVCPLARISPCELTITQPTHGLSPVVPRASSASSIASRIRASWSAPIEPLTLHAGPSRCKRVALFARGREGPLRADHAAQLALEPLEHHVRDLTGKPHCFLECAQRLSVGTAAPGGATAHFAELDQILSGEAFERSRP